MLKKRLGGNAPHLWAVPWPDSQSLRVRVFPVRVSFEGWACAWRMWWEWDPQTQRVTSVLCSPKTACVGLIVFRRGENPCDRSLVQNESCSLAPSPLPRPMCTIADTHSTDAPLVSLDYTVTWIHARSSSRYDVWPLSYELMVEFSLYNLTSDLSFSKQTL